MNLSSLRKQMDNKYSQKIENFLAKVWPYCALLLLIIVTTQWQWHYHATYVFSDTLLHFQRFYDAKMQIETGNFSWFQTNYAFYHSGRIFNALYGPSFAYFNGFLLLICRTWHRYQTVITYLTYFTAGSGMYILAHNKAKINTVLSLFLAMLYLQFGIVPGIAKFNWMAIGGALAPFVGMQCLNFLQDKKRPVHVLTLAITMSLIAQVHVLSTLICAVNLAFFAVISLIINRDKALKIVIDILKAIGISLLLTANVWGSMLVVYSGNYISTPASYKLFEHAVNFYRSTNVHGQISLVLSILFTLQFVYILFNFKRNFVNTSVTCVSGFFLLISSSLMPWKSIQYFHPSLGRMLQFPYRMSLLAYPLMLVAIGLTISEFKKLPQMPSIYNIGITLVVIALVQNSGLLMGLDQSRTSRYLNPDKIALIGSKYWIRNRGDIQTTLKDTNSGRLFDEISHIEPDYMPYRKDKGYINASKTLYGKTIVDRYQNYHYKVKGSHLFISWESKKAGTKTLPVVMYKQSQLKLNGHKAKIEDFNRNYQPIVNVKKGKNTAELYFKVPVYFWILLFISIFFWMVAIFYLIM